MAGLLTVEKTRGEFKNNPSSPLLETVRFPTTHGFQCYWDSLTSLGSEPLWVGCKQGPKVLVLCGVCAEQLPDMSSAKGVHICIFSTCRNHLCQRQGLCGQWSITQCKSCYLWNEKAQPITVLFLLHCYPKPPLCSEWWGPSISSWLDSLLYSCLPCSPAACELMLLVVHSSPKSVSVLLCLLFLSMFRLE